MNRLALLLVVLLPAVPRLRGVSLPPIFSDHMVLQAGVTVPVWGWAEPGEEVRVGIGSQTKSTKAGTDGKWRLNLDPLKSGESLTLTVKGGNLLTVNDVLVGEVWLCSGQSNMDMAASNTLNFAETRATANLPRLRVYRDQSNTADKPQERGRGKWTVCSPETVGSFASTAFFYGRELHRALNQPVGLVVLADGGTTIEAWMSWESQKDLPQLKPVFEKWAQAQAAWDPVAARQQYEIDLAAWKEMAAQLATEGKTPPRRAPDKPGEPRLDIKHPATRYNGRIHPYLGYAIRGAVWYQGESNANSLTSGIYDLLLETMIKDWRARWGYDFPFAWVQLANVRPRQTAPVEDTHLTRVREGLLKGLRVPNSGMAEAIDIGDADNVHFKNKPEAGRRLAVWALHDVYGRKDVVASGPLPASHEIKGSEVTISFAHADGGLVAKGGELKGFAIAGADKAWFRASAKIVGSKVVVSSPQVKSPVAVRYAWADNPDCNLYNGADLPASPFRTDDWPVQQSGTR